MKNTMETTNKEKLEKKGKKSSDAKIRANRKYNETAYDRLNLYVKKGNRERIKKYAKDNGLSVNEYILSKIREDVDIID